MWMPSAMAEPPSSAGLWSISRPPGSTPGIRPASCPPTASIPALLEEITRATKAMAKELNVIGLMNVQYAIKDQRLFVIEVNPRASRTVPFVSKATGVPLAKLATKIMLGRTLADLGLTAEVIPVHLSVKEAVLPFNRFPNVDTLLGPEMKSTGEVMGIGSDFGSAYAKAQLGAGQQLPIQGTIFISVMDADKPALVPVAKEFERLGFLHPHHQRYLPIFTRQRHQHRADQ